MFEYYFPTKSVRQKSQYKNKCALGLGIDEENQLKFSSIVLKNYCVLFDTVLNQIAFAPKVVEPKDMEWIFCN
uniref:Uncharacterized protein n=1 Tax=Meloidogyne enterolobii TaxID=390850 RepID=A0A6V7TR85_MELEN|nr:unnamed protein product [Meloidogyne enterolobii]